MVERRKASGWSLKNGGKRDWQDARVIRMITFPRRKHRGLAGCKAPFFDSPFLNTISHTFRNKKAKLMLGFFI
jgi:hypothetical protein